MKKIALITVLLLVSTSAVADNWFAPLVVGGIGGYLIGRPTTIQQQPVVIQNNPPIIMQQHPNANNRVGFTPIYQWQNIADDSCSCIRRILVQIN